MQLSAGAVGSDLPQGLPLTGRGFICRFNDNDLAERLYAGHLLSLPEFLGGHRHLPFPYWMLLYARSRWPSN